MIVIEQNKNHYFVLSGKDEEFFLLLPGMAGAFGTGGGGGGITIKQKQFETLY